MKLKRFLVRVGQSIAEQSISFVSLVVSVGALVYNSLSPTRIPVAGLSATGAAGTAQGVSLGLFAGIIIGLVLTYGVIKAVKQ